MMVNKLKFNWRHVVVLFALILIECYFFRSVLGNDLLFGDLGDGRLNNLFAEHWYRFFQGKEDAFDLRIFHPIKNTLAFSDCTLGVGIPYSILRALGFNMYSAYKWTIIGIHAFGSVCLYYLLRKKLRLNIGSSFIGIVIFSASNAYQVQIRASHLQLIAISLIPGFCIFLFNFFSGFKKKQKRIFSGMGCIIYLEWLLYTSYYPVFFLLFFLLISGCIAIIVYNRRKINLIKLGAEFIRTSWLEMLAYLAVGGVLAVPFLKLYLPAMATFGGRSWMMVATMLPTLSDFINVSNQNLVYGQTLFEDSPGETTCGFPFITVALLLTSIICYYNRYILSKNNKKARAPIKLYLLTTLSLSIFFIFVLLVVDGKYSLWYLVYSVIPGASAIRACSRFLQFLSLPVGVVIAVFTDEIYRKLQKRVKSSGVVLLAALTLILTMENTLVGTLGNWTITDRLNFTESIPAPPEDCEVMYILPDGEERPNWVYQLDAWEIANKYDLKTLNGYSGQNPLGWRLWEISSDSYSAYVDQWCRDNQINSGVYAYDAANAVWRSHMEEKQYTIGREVFFDGSLTDAHRYFFEGMSRTEDGFAWTEGNQVQFYVDFATEIENDLIMQINLKMIFNELQHVIVMCGDHILWDDVIAEVAPITVCIPEKCVQDRSLELTFQLPEAISPKEIGMSEDDRDLALAFESFSIIDSSNNSPLKS